jgi:hypothetical protein
MRSMVLVLAAAALVGFAGAASAQSDTKPGTTSKGASQYAPGQRATEPGGAKEYAPGQQKKQGSSRGASEYAPGQQDRTTTGGKTKKKDM